MSSKVERIFSMSFILMKAAATYNEGVKFLISFHVKKIVKFCTYNDIYFNTLIIKIPYFKRFVSFSFIMAKP
jgi:hypothetical protein